MKIIDFFWSFFGRTGVNFLKAFFQILYLTIIPLEYFGPFFKATAFAAILSIISSIGIPAFYARNRLKKTDEFVFNYYLNIVFWLNLIFFIFLTSGYFLFLEENPLSLKNIIYPLSGILVLFSGFNQMHKGFHFKRHRHKRVGLISFFSYLLGGMMALIFGIAINELLILPIYMIVPLVIESFLLNINVNKKFIGFTFKISQKTRKFLKYDVLRNLLNSGFNSLLITTFGFIFNTREVALLGLCTTWGNRTILMINGVLKQVFYPLFVRDNVKGIKQTDLLTKNLDLLTLGIFLLAFACLLIFNYFNLWNSAEHATVYLYLLGSILINCLVPIADILKSRGLMKILFNMTLVVSVFYYILIGFNIKNIDLSDLIFLYLLTSFFSLIMHTTVSIRVLKFWPTRTFFLNSILVLIMISALKFQQIQLIYSIILVTALIFYQIFNIRKSI
ncbi:MAG: oligosaccharide flippase family protein [Flavobacteriaceae bacterium]